MDSVVIMTLTTLSLDIIHDIFCLWILSVCPHIWSILIQLMCDLVTSFSNINHYIGHGLMYFIYLPNIIDILAIL